MSTFTPDDLAKMASTQDIRQNIIDSLTEGDIPDDPKLLKLLLTTLQNSDQAIVAKARVKLQSEENDTTKANQEVLLQLLSHTRQENHEVQSAPRIIDEMPSDVYASIEILETEASETSDEAHKEDFTQIIDDLENGN